MFFQPAVDFRKFLGISGNQRPEIPRNFRKSTPDRKLIDFFYVRVSNGAIFGPRWVPDLLGPEIGTAPYKYFGLISRLGFALLEC